jgi:glycerol kinase
VKVVAAIDSGTTGTSVLLFDRQARVKGRAYEELPARYPKPGWVEHDPERIFDLSRRVLARALRSAGLSKSAVEAMSITNQRETVVLWDRRRGKSVAPAIVWQDRRTEPHCRRLRARGKERLVRSKTGLVLDPYFSATKVRWLLDETPGLADRAKRGEIAFGTVDSWLLWKWTGGRVHATDETNAARTLLYDVRRLRWDDDLLRTFGVPKELLPSVVPATGPFGSTAAVAPLREGVPVAAMVGDQQSSLLGHGCTRAGEAKCTYGTGSFLLLHTGPRFVASRHGLLSTLAVGAGGGASYALEGSVFSSGSAVQWLRDGLEAIRVADDSEAIARRQADAGGVHVVPAFAGLGAPWWDARARGAILGITRGTTLATIVRATLESLAYQTRDVLEAMQRDAGVRLRRLAVDGGASANDWLMQFQADVLGIEVERPKMVAATARGAALLAGAGLGWWTLKDLPEAGGGSTTFRPRLDRAERDRLYDGWLGAVAQVRHHV